MRGQPRFERVRPPRYRPTAGRLAGVAVARPIAVSERVQLRRQVLPLERWQQPGRADRVPRDPFQLQLVVLSQLHHFLGDLAGRRGISPAHLRSRFVSLFLRLCCSGCGCWTGRLHSHFPHDKLSVSLIGLILEALSGPSRRSVEEADFTDLAWVRAKILQLYLVLARHLCLQAFQVRFWACDREVVAVHGQENLASRVLEAAGRRAADLEARID